MFLFLKKSFVYIDSNDARSKKIDLLKCATVFLTIFYIVEKVHVCILSVTLPSGQTSTRTHLIIKMFFQCCFPTFLSIMR